MRTYPQTFNGETYKTPSVTTIIGDCTDKSGALTQWAANQTVEWIRKHGILIDGGYWINDDDLDDARLNFRSVSKDALDIGSTVHGAIEHYFKTGDEPVGLNEQAQNAYDAFREWEQANDIKTIATEQVVMCETYAGTLDWVGTICGKVYVVDWKTSKGFYGRDYFYQIAAYRALWSGAEGCGVLRIDKETGKPEWRDSSNKYFDDLAVFRAMVELFYRKHPKIAAGAGWNPPF